MNCVWHWATQTPHGLFDSIIELMTRAAARGYSYDRIVLVGAPRAEPAIIVRDFTEMTRRKSPRFRVRSPL